MYAATLEDTRYTFEASGSLWKDALVLKDRQTGSLWSQVSGKAIDGPALGLELELFPSEFITFGALKEKYPHAKLLSKPELGKDGSGYEGYFSDPNRFGMFGRAFESKEIGGKEQVLAFRIGRDAVALPIGNVKTSAAAVIGQMDRTVAVFYDARTGESVGFSLSNEAASEGKLKVEMDGSVSFMGEKLTVEGLKSRKAPRADEFESLPLITAYWFAWKSFFPDAQIVEMTKAE